MDILKQIMYNPERATTEYKRQLSQAMTWRAVQQAGQTVEKNHREPGSTLEQKAALAWAKACSRLHKRDIAQTPKAMIAWKSFISQMARNPAMAMTQFDITVMRAVRATSNL